MKAMTNVRKRVFEKVCPGDRVGNQASHVVYVLVTGYSNPVGTLE